MFHETKIFFSPETLFESEDSKPIVLVIPGLTSDSNSQV